MRWLLIIPAALGIWTMLLARPMDHETWQTRLSQNERAPEPNPRRGRALACELANTCRLYQVVLERCDAAEDFAACVAAGMSPPLAGFIPLCRDLLLDPRQSDALLSASHQGSCLFVRMLPYY